MGEDGTTGTWWVKARDAAFLAPKTAIPPLSTQTKIYLVQNINSAQDEKRWFRCNNNNKGLKGSWTTGSRGEKKDLMRLHIEHLTFKDTQKLTFPCNLQMNENKRFAMICLLILWMTFIIMYISITDLFTRSCNLIRHSRKALMLE